jgi:hypothetical protein
LVGVSAESETSRGRLIDLMLRGVCQPLSAPWSAAFVHHVGYWAHFDFAGSHSSWPLPATNDPRELYAFAEERAILADEPEQGDVFLLLSPVQKQLGRAGIIIEVEEVPCSPRRLPTWECLTVEGETTEFGASTGPGIFVLRRQLSPARRDRFLRWTALDARGAAADPALETRRVGGRLILRRAA